MWRYEVAVFLRRGPHVVIGLGVIGYGYWGPNLVRNFVESTSARMVAVADSRSDRLAIVTRRYPTVEVTADVFFRSLRCDGSV